jgi:hypothetical protein
MGFGSQASEDYPHLSSLPKVHSASQVKASNPDVDAIQLANLVRDQE